MTISLSNNRINSFKKLISPEEVKELIPSTEKAKASIRKSRKEIIDILEGKDKRFIVIAGPCSIHDYDVAMEYAHKINELREKYSDKLYIMMRTYFEKPRTIGGWKGLINDPLLNNTYDINEGLKLSRKILVDIADLELPTATEILDPIVAGYIAQLTSWIAIGARTTESQTHRQMTSGLSAPVGFKNSTNGDLDVAINAIRSTAQSHNFIGIDNKGNCSILQTAGNPYGHIVLRGGNGKPNYHLEDIEACEEKLTEVGLKPQIIVDCSHENSRKDFSKQKIVVRDIMMQKKFGNKSILGIMLESNLNEGQQSIPENPKDLKHGISVTDSCIGWEETESVLKDIYLNL